MEPSRNEVVITAEDLPLGTLAAHVVCPTAGAIATFIGTTRDHFEGKKVLRLEVGTATLPLCPHANNADYVLQFTLAVRSISAHG